VWAGEQRRHESKKKGMGGKPERRGISRRQGLGGGQPVYKCGNTKVFGWYGALSTALKDKTRIGKRYSGDANTPERKKRLLFMLPC